METKYHNPGKSHTHDYLWGPIKNILGKLKINPPRLFEIGCGNGSTANMLSKLDWEVTGIDPSESGIKIANEAYPKTQLFVGSTYDDLASNYGKFPVVLSLEVIEHLYDPRQFARNVFELLDHNGAAIISTPYHGYIKNLALALTGKFDDHFTALLDGGHIKFWSEKTLKTLLEEAGFKNITFIRAGRIPPLAKSMIAVAKKI